VNKAKAFLRGSGIGFSGRIPDFAKGFGRNSLLNFANGLKKLGMIQYPFRAGEPVPKIAKSMVDLQPKKPVLAKDMNVSGLGLELRSPSFLGEGPREFAGDRGLAANDYAAKLKTYSDVVRDVYKRHNIKDASEKVYQAMGDVPDQINEVVRQLGPLVRDRQQMEELLGVSRDQDPSGEIQARLDEFDKENKAKMEALVQQKDALYDEAWRRIEKVARKHSDARVALWMEPAEKRPEWLAGIMKPNEIAAANELRALMKSFRDAGKSVGLAMLDNDYITHLLRLREMYEASEKYNGAKDDDNIRAILDFHHRDPRSVNLFPSVHAAMDYYIPTISRKLANQPVLNKWYQSDTGVAGVNDYLDPTSKYYQPNFGNWVEGQMREMQNPRRPGATEKILRTGKNIEIAKDLAFNQRVGFRHAVTKFANNIAMHRAYMLDAAKDYGMYVAGKAENLPFIKTAFKGITGKDLDFDSMTPEETKTVQALVSNFIGRRQIMAALNEDPLIANYRREIFNGFFGPSFRGVANKPLKAGRTLRNALGAPVTQVEALENFFNMAASIQRGEGKGLSTAEQSRALINNIMRISQCGGYDASQFVKSQMGGLTAFTQAPSKNIELLAETLKRGLKGEKDIYGTNGTTDLLATMAVYGALGLGSAKLGTPLWHTLIHLPFINVNLLRPGAQYAYYKVKGTQTQSPEDARKALLALAEMRGIEENSFNSIAIPAYDVGKDLITIAMNPKGFIKGLPAAKQLKAEMGRPPRGFKNWLDYLANVSSNDEYQKRRNIRTGIKRMRSLNRQAEE
jgi:hypothetical protein